MIFIAPRSFWGPGFNGLLHYESNLGNWRLIAIVTLLNNILGQCQRPQWRISVYCSLFSGPWPCSGPANGMKGLKVPSKCPYHILTRVMVVIFMYYHFRLIQIQKPSWDERWKTLGILMTGVRGASPWPASSVGGRFLWSLCWRGAAVTAALPASCRRGRPPGGGRASSGESSVRHGRSDLIMRISYKAQQTGGGKVSNMWSAVRQFSYFTGTILPGFLWSLGLIHHRMMLVWIMTESVRMTR